MVKKKKKKLKKKVKLGLIIIIFLALITYTGINIYNDYLYKQTNEYKLLEKGYDIETAKIIQQKLDENQIVNLLNEKYYSYLNNILNEKYFLSNNLSMYIEYYNENNNMSFDKIISIVNVGANNEWYTNSKELEDKFDYSILVNKFNKLPDNYSLNNIKTFSATYAYGTVSAEENCYNAFIKLADDARKENITFILTSGYRSYDNQNMLYKKMVSTNGQSYADEYAARPGFSEHQTGLALDIFTLDANTTDNFKNSIGYNWLVENAANYGFILRYPEDKTYLTGYNGESWHWRYLGVDLAKKVKNSGLTYDEYYAFYLDK